MTHEQKIKELKGTIQFLIEKEGRSNAYISRLLEVDRKILTHKVKEWNFKKADIHRLTPSNQKWANKHKQLIKSRLDNNVPIKAIAEELNVSEDYLRNIIIKVDILNKAKEDYLKRKDNKAKENFNRKIENSKLDYDFKEIDGEIWEKILGYDGYYVSNMGRIKRYVKTYDKYTLLKPQENCKSGKMYINIKGKGLSVARLVGFAFIEGYSKENNTIDHKDGDIKNNRASNLQWVKQLENNKATKRKFKKIILNDKYEFKTVEALSKFLGKSWTQTSRYLDSECEFDGKLEIIY